jgi:GT2 family glycosyltransferase
MTPDWSAQASTDDGQQLPLASVVICSRNRPLLLRDAVASVLESRPVPAELVVIDQSDSSDDYFQKLTSCSGCTVRYHWSRTVGASRARNEGARAARNELVAFLDDDVVVAPDWFGTMIQTLSRFGPRAVVTGRVLAATAELRGGFAPSTNADSASVVYSGPRCEGVLYSATMALDRSVFGEIGWFDERLGPGTRFPAAEDNDFCFRLLSARYDIVHEARAAIYHRAWRSPDAYLPLRWNYGRGQGAFYAKHVYGEPSFVKGCMLANMRGHLARFIGRLRNDRHLDLGELAYSFGVLVGFGQWLLLERLAR